MPLSRIDDNLFVGGIYDLLDEDRVVAVVNLSMQRVVVEWCEDNEIEYLDIQQPDGFGVTHDDWVAFRAFMLRHHKMPVGIVCGAGLSRSVGYAAAHMVMEYGMTWEGAIIRLRAQRGNLAEPAHQIARDLKEYVGAAYVPMTAVEMEDDTEGGA